MLPPSDIQRALQQHVQILLALDPVVPLMKHRLRERTAFELALSSWTEDSDVRMIAASAVGQAQSMVPVIEDQRFSERVNLGLRAHRDREDPAMQAVLDRLASDMRNGAWPDPERAAASVSGASPDRARALWMGILQEVARWRADG